MPDTMMELWGLFASAFISSTVAPGGSEAVLAYLAAQGHYLPWLLLAIATVGNTLGAMTTWWLGHLAAQKIGRHATLSSHQQRAIVWVERYGVVTLLFSWLPVVGDAFCFVAGWLSLPLLVGITLIFLGKLSRYAIVIGVFQNLLG